MNEIILTEQRNPDTKDIDIVSTLKVVEMINNEDKKVASVIEKELANIAKAVDIIASQMQQGGNLLYFGAGTSGRLGVLDASEIPPTFGASPELVRGYIAGGDYALRNAIEGAEDDYEAGVNDLINSGVTNKDVVVGISASGNPRYLLGVLEKAKELGCSTIGVVCNKKAKIQEFCDILISPEVGPESITGSSRMKAGTAQKMVLNMLTTASMVKQGKTYENYMIDVQPTNAKLKDRAARIVAELADVDYKTAQEVLDECDYQVKNAVVMLLNQCNSEEAIELLNKNDGVLRKVLYNSNC